LTTVLPIVKPINAFTKVLAEDVCIIDDPFISLSPIMKVILTVQFVNKILTAVNFVVFDHHANE